MDRGHDPTTAVGLVTPAPPGQQATAEAHAALSLLDRVFPPGQSDHDLGDVWMTVGCTTAIARHLIESRSHP